MQTSFPVFEADQVLTNDHLNQLRRYLDVQNRLTRAKLIGCGIVCGLELTCSPASIKVSKGCALTSQGYLITLCDAEFTHCIPYTVPEQPDAGHLDLLSRCGDVDTSRIPFYGFTEPLLELITQADLDSLSPEVKANASTLSDLSGIELDALAVVIFLETEELKLKNCDTNDCNDKGSRMDFEPKFLLVPKTVLDDIDAEAGGRVSRNPLPQIELGRYNVPVRNLLSTSSILTAFESLVNNQTIDKIADALSRSYDQYNHLLKDEASNPFRTVGDTLKNTRQAIKNFNPLFIQYFYDFLDDILKAYREFREKAYYVNSECCINEFRFPLHVMLGEATVNTLPGNQSAYRQDFIYSPLFDSQSWRLNEIRFLFTRMKLLILTYLPDNPSAFARKIVKITPSRFGNASLSDRCIPYYYNVLGGGGQPALFRTWDYKKTVRGEADHNLSYKSNEYTDASNKLVREPLLFDIERYDFFRVEGHIGKQVSVALTDILTNKQDNNLPIEVIALSADFIGAILKGEEPQCIIQDLEADYRIIIAEFICKLHDAFCNIYKFEFKPKPLDVLVATPATAPGRTTAARRRAAADVAAGISAAGLATVAKLDDDDLEVNELMAKIDFTGPQVAHPVLSQLVSEAHLTKNYVKGSSLLRICGVRKGSIGDVYLSNISGNIFTRPVIGTNVKAAGLYTKFFELIDSIESMFKILLSNELSELNLVEFKTAYNRYEKAVNDLARQLRTITDKVQVFLSTCIVEKLEALKEEYRRRINQYNLARKFNNYFKTHGGIEHKAGVVKGGTFILVYHEVTRGKPFDVGALFVNKKLGTLMLAKHPDLLEPVVSDEKMKIVTDELRTAVELDCPTQYTFFNKAITDFVKADVNIPEASKEALLAAMRKPADKPGFDFQNGTVIADFYVPYLCCSDCTPVSYVVQPPEPLPLTAVADQPVCDAEGKVYTVKINVSGGTSPYVLSVNGVVLQDDTIELTSGSPDTKVTVKDAAGNTTEVTIKSHRCPVPCNLPCNGDSEKCRYILWIQKPTTEEKVPHVTADANLTFIDENGSSKTTDVSSIFKEVFATPANKTIINSNYDSAFKELIARLNKEVPEKFVNKDEPMFEYDPATQLLLIDRFICHEVILEFKASIGLGGKKFNIKVTYSRSGVTIVKDQPGAEGNDIGTVKVPPFGCIQRNKCTGKVVNKCTEDLRITKIIADQVTPGKPEHDFSAEPTFDKYFWFFHTGLPPYSDQRKPKRITMAGGSANPLVKLIGIKTTTGCFAIAEQKPVFNDHNG